MSTDGPAASAEVWDQLTTTSFVVLGLVDALDEPTSYDLQQRASQSIANFWAFPRSQLYAEPQRLARLGLLRSEQETSGRRRRRFGLTDLGAEALRAWLADPGAARRELRDEALLKVAFGHAASPEALAELARSQQEVHRGKLAEYEGYRDLVPAEGPTRFLRATLEMGLRYERLAVEYWRDVETLAETGEMPVCS